MSKSFFLSAVVLVPALSPPARPLPVLRSRPKFCMDECIGIQNGVEVQISSIG